MGYAKPLTNQTQKKRPNQRATTIYAIIGIVAACFAIMVIGGLIIEGRESPFQQFAKNACAGKGRSDAAAFTNDASFHPLIALDEKGEISSWTTTLESWRPATPNKLQLAACIKSNKIELSVCHYSGGSQITRWQHGLTLKLFSIQTGSMVAQQDFFGDKPGCPGSTYTNDSVSGGNVSVDEVQAWLSQYVKPLVNGSTETPAPVTPTSAILSTDTPESTIPPTPSAWPTMTKIPWLPTPTP